MSLAHFLEDFNALPEHARREVAEFAAFLKQKHETNDDAFKKNKRRYKQGLAKGMYIVPPDFDAPLSDFADYM